MDSLLNLLDLNDRKVENLDEISLNTNINYNEVNIKLNKERQASLEFLKNSL